MKIYILADMEGISGIRHIKQVQADSPEYAEGCKLMMDDINAAIDGAFLGGATEVVACDTHGGGGQVRIGNMDSKAVYEMPDYGKLMPSLDNSFDGVILIGHHARAGTLNGFLDHTMSSTSWFEYKINDKVMGEIGIEAAYAGYYGVPVIMVSGDEAATKEAKAQLGEVECAIVKWGIGCNRAKCLSLPKAYEIIRKATRKAITSIDTFKPYKPSLPATVQLTLYRSDMADELASRTGVNRINARTVQRQVTSLLDIFPGTW